MKLKISQHVSQSAKGTNVYSCDPVPASAPFVHRILSRDKFEPGEIVTVNHLRGAMNVSVDDDGRPVLVWWV